MPTDPTLVIQHPDACPLSDDVVVEKHCGERRKALSKQIVGMWVLIVVLIAFFIATGVSAWVTNSNLAVQAEGNTKEHSEIFRALDRIEQKLDKKHP